MPAEMKTAELCHYWKAQKELKMSLLACSTKTGDLDRQLKISTHNTQSALRRQPLHGATKQLILELTGLREGRMETDAGKKRTKHQDPLQTWVGNEKPASGSGFPRVCRWFFPPQCAAIKSRLGGIKTCRLSFGCLLWALSHLSWVTRK